MSQENKTPPILKHENKVFFNKIILYYALFYIALKAYVIIFQNNWLLENLIISFPILLLGLAAFYFKKNEKENWYFIFLSIGVALLIRLNETEWIQKIHYFINA